jgi:thioredoxin reductase (NADPH)
MFLFVGADPETEWLSDSGVAMDSKGFILTGNDARSGGRLFETSVNGIFAIGDVRAGSIKRVSAGV